MRMHEKTLLNKIRKQTAVCNKQYHLFHQCLSIFPCCWYTYCEDCLYGKGSSLD